VPLDEVLAFPSPTLPVTRVRSTVLLASVASLRDRGHFAAYAARLPHGLHETIVDNIAGVWVPVEDALAHYTACDDLALYAEAQRKLGEATWERTKGTLLGTVVRLARTAGATPWTFFPKFQRFWSRAYDGGGVRVLRVWPKDAQIDCVENVLFTSGYYRNAVRGLVSEVIRLFAATAVVRERAATRSSAVTMHAQWV
jgi:hypothetical protein